MQDRVHAAETMDDRKRAAWRNYQDVLRLMGNETLYLPLPQYDTHDEYNAITAEQFNNLALLAAELRTASFSAIEDRLRVLCREFFFAPGGYHRMEAAYSVNWVNQACACFQYMQGGMGRCVYLAMHLDVKTQRCADLESELEAAQSQSTSLQADLNARVQAAQNLLADTQLATIKELEAKVADAWATTRAIRVQKEQAHADHAKAKKALETRISELEARAATTVDDARVEALTGDLAAARAKFEAAIAEAAAELDTEKAERRELVLDINAMGKEVDTHFAALQREETRAIAAETRAIAAETRAAEAETRAAEAETRAAEAETRAAEAETREPTQRGGRKRAATEVVEPTRRGGRKRTAPDRYGG